VKRFAPTPDAPQTCLIALYHDSRPAARDTLTTGVKTVILHTERALPEAVGPL